jgi:hypothetical protein
MVLWPEKSFWELMQEVSSSFQSRPIELVLLIILIIAAIVFFILVVRLQVRRRQEERLRQAREQYEKAAAEKNLNKMERNVIEHMSRVIKNGELRKHEIIRDPATFAEAAEKLREKGLISRKTIYEMRKKLRAKPTKKSEGEISTTKLPEGTHIYFIDEQNERFHGTVTENHSSILFIKPNINIKDIPEGTKLKGLFKQDEDVYSFVTKVYRKDKEVLRCLHSQHARKQKRKASAKPEEEEREQQERDFYRRPIRMQIGIKKHIVDEKPVATTLVDLGGGGARVANPSKKFKEGDDVLLFLDLEDEGKVQAPGRIVKISEENKDLHIQFHSIKDSTRDKIIGFILTAKDPTVNQGQE